MCTLLGLLMSGAKSTDYLCKQLECTEEDLYYDIAILTFVGYRIDSFEEGGKVYVFLN